MRIAYTGADIFTGNEWLLHHTLIVQDGTVQEVLRAGLPYQADAQHDFEGQCIAPGLIDLQIYGGGGALFSSDPSLDTLENLHHHCLQHGTIGFLATMPTNTSTMMEAAIEASRAFQNKYPDVLFGLHLEGPFLNASKRGAHPADLIQPPTVDDVRYWLEKGRGVLRMMTLAPELCSSEILCLGMEYGVIFSAGHSNADFHTAYHSFGPNACPVATHFFNAMSQLGSREPGLVGAILDHPTVCASIIADGVHVDYASVRIAKRVLGERLWLITDAVDDSGTGSYQFFRKDDHFVNGQDVLGGSALTLLKAIQNCADQGVCSWEEAVRMASLYPARVLGLENRYGRIAPGYVGQFWIFPKK